MPGPPWHEMAKSDGDAGFTDATRNDRAGVDCATKHIRAAVKQASVRSIGRISSDSCRSNFNAGVICDAELAGFVMTPVEQQFGVPKGTRYETVKAVRAG